MGDILLKTGSVINERYEVLGPLGHGSQGAVYKVSDCLAGGEFRALKLCLSGPARPILESEFLRLFEIHHPNLARVFEFGAILEPDSPVNAVHQFTPFFTEAFIGGARADELLRQMDDTSRFEATVCIGMAIARALSMLHACSILHLDIKPANIIALPDLSEIKLIDLGLAHFKHRAIGLRIGTPGFMAPEALDGFADERADIYSLGQTMIALLQGSVPRFDPSFPSRIPNGLPSAMTRLLERMTAKDPECRFVSADEVVVGLQQCLPMIHEPASSTFTLPLAVIDAQTPETRRARARSSRLFGREIEVESLLGVMGRFAEQSRPSMAVVHGPEGIGKTRLILTAVARAQTVAVQSGSVAPSLISGSLRQTVRCLVGPGNGSGANTVLQRWIERTRDDEREPTYMEESVLKSLVDILLSLRGPVVVVFQNVTSHWTTVFFHWLSELSSERLFPGILVIAECDDAPRFPAHGTASSFLEIALRPLNQDNADWMMESIAGRPLCEKERVQLFHKTAGNPRMLEAFAGSLMSEGARHLLDESGPLELSLARDTLHASLDTRQLAIALSVLGQPAPLDVLACITGISDRGRLASALKELDARGVVLVTVSGIELAEFLRLGIAQVLTEEELRAFHRRAFDALKNVANPAQLAFHAAGACDTDMTIIHARAAGEDALRRGKPAEAIPYLELLPSVVPDIDRSREVLRLARCYREIGRYEKVLSVLEGCDEDAAQLERGAALRLAGRAGDAKEVLQPLTASDSPRIALEARAILARIEVDRGDFSAASRLLGDVSPAPEIDLLESGTLSVAGLIAMNTGDMAQASRFFDAGLRAAETSGSLRVRARFQAYRGMMAHSRRDWLGASECYESAFLLADESADAHGAATYVVNLAAALTERGEISAALRRYRDGMCRLEGVGRPEELAGTEMNYAQLALRLGDTDTAMNVVRRVLDGKTAESNTEVRATALMLCGDILGTSERHLEAAGTLEQALQLLRDIPGQPRWVVCTVHLIFALIFSGRKEEAVDRMNELTSACGREVLMGPDVLALRVAIEMPDGSELSDALDALIAALSPENGRDDLQLLRPLVIAARAAENLHRTELASHLARRGLSWIEACAKSTPALHRPGKYPWEPDLRNILKTNALESTATTPSQWMDQAARAMWLERLIAMTARLNSQQKIEPLLELIMDAALELTAAERGFLLLYEDGELQVRCARNMNPAEIIKNDSGYCRTVAQRCAESGETIVTSDAQEDEQYRNARSVMALSLRYIVAVPLRMQGTSRGTIYVDSRNRGRFDEMHLELLRTLADHAAIAVTNAELVSGNARKQKQIERLNRRLSSELASRESELATVRRDLIQKSEELAGRFSHMGIIGNSEPMKAVFRLIDRVGASDIPVVISGESGTGKELVAKAIHYAGKRRNKPFVAENCGAIPPTLLESVLFGHARGAFTGAVSDHPGLFVEANGGTLFLDEVGNMPLEMQASLLRVLQEGEVRAVGGVRSRRVDVRVLVASNANLKQLVKERRFREDLYYRLNVMEIHLPPLRDRAEDIPLLARHLVQQLGTGRAVEITSAAMSLFINHSWPGNVRQLENEVMRALVMCDTRLDVEHLSPTFAESAISEIKDLSDLNMERQLERLKQQMIRIALGRSRGNRSKAAELLGLSRFGLQKMLTRMEE